MSLSFTTLLTVAHLKCFSRSSINHRRQKRRGWLLIGGDTASTFSFLFWSQVCLTESHSEYQHVESGAYGDRFHISKQDWP